MINRLLADFEFVRGDSRRRPNFAMDYERPRTSWDASLGQLAAPAAWAPDLQTASETPCCSAPGTGGAYRARGCVPLRPSLISDPALLRTLEGHAASVSAVALTPDGKRAVSGSGITR